MAESARNLKISSPGQIGRLAVGLDVRSGESILEDSITITSNNASNLYGENAVVNDDAEVIDQTSYTAGHAIIFTLVCLENLPQRTRNETPYYLKISYRTDGQDPAEDDLTYSKEVDVYPEGIPIP